MSSASAKPPHGDVPESLRHLPPMKLPPGYKSLDEYLDDYWEDGLIRTAEKVAREYQEQQKHQANRKQPQ